MTVTPTEYEATSPARAGLARIPAPHGATPVRDDNLVEEDLLVEDVSIDGMCGVY
jgi:mycofactocin precursor